jgi:hypothetical protein
LGRSQAVRQRILIPPFGGSIPPAPARFKALSSVYEQVPRAPFAVLRSTFLAREAARAWNEGWTNIPTFKSHRRAPKPGGCDLQPES